MVPVILVLWPRVVRFLLLLLLVLLGENVALFINLCLVVSVNLQGMPLLRFQVDTHNGTGVLIADTTTSCKHSDKVL